MVYLFLANGFEDMEAVIPYDMLKRENIEVFTVGVGTKTVKSAHGLTVIADISEKEADLDEFDAIILPGGMPGATNLKQSDVVISAVSKAIENGKIIGAICAAPGVVLAGTGALTDKEYTCFPGFETKEGKYRKDGCITDGRLVTASGPLFAMDFATALVKALKK